LGEYHLPLNWRWQLDAMSEVLLPFNNDSKALIVRNQGIATFLVDDRWRADIQFRHARQIARYWTGYASRVSSSWWTDAAFGLRYYIEDRTSLSLSVRQNQSSGVSGVRPTLSASDYASKFACSYEVSVGVSYRFSAGMEAVGMGLR
jgi:hypothetical protein